MTLHELATKIDQLAFEADYYHYADTIGIKTEERNSNVETILHDFEQGNFKSYLQWLIELVEESI